MKYSQLFGKTIREAPTGVRLASHKLLLQGGFIRELTAGRYEFLPLGLRVYEKIINVIQREMETIGSQRVVTPTLHPKEIWQKTGRDAVWGKNLLIVEDPRSDQEFTMSATAEGVITEMVAGFSPSYRDLPILVHQFALKFRNEKRPRGGLLRLREFLMKDAYSFDIDQESFAKSYQKFYEAYVQIAKTFDLRALPVEADNGALGGDYSHEFMIEAEFGEDKIMKCDACDYAANLEKAESVFPVYPQEKDQRQMEAVLGKGLIGVEPLAKFLNIPVTQTTKTLLYQVEDNMVAVCVRGEYSVSETKLAKLLGTMDLDLASEEDVEKVTGAKVGYAGPIGLPKEVAVYWDYSTAGRLNFECGANKTNYHNINVNFGRDVQAPKEFFDIREVKEGEKCPRCKKGALAEIKAIEFGHIFSYGDFYSRAHDAYFVDRDGRKKLMLMGAYGIGVDRTIATIVETHHDDRGIIWPEVVAPYKFHLVGLNGKGEDIYQKLVDSGQEVLFDDRDVSAGEKFADADLIGIPFRLVVSDKTGEKIELKKRNEKETSLVDFDQLPLL